MPTNTRSRISSPAASTRSHSNDKNLGKGRSLDLGPEDGNGRPKGKRPKSMSSAAVLSPRKQGLRSRKPLGSLTEASFNKKGGDNDDDSDDDQQTTKKRKPNTRTNQDKSDATIVPVVTKRPATPIPTAQSKSRRRKSAPETRPQSSLDTDCTPTLQPPEKGNRFRVFFDKADDAFGEDTERARGYFFGTATAVRPVKIITATSNNKKSPLHALNYKITIQFDTGETEIMDYPGDANTDDAGATNSNVPIERIVSSSEGTNNLWMGETTGDFAGDTNPARLDVGDLVFCNYQNQRKRRYRGRVAKVSEDGKSCDIAYDDKEYEEGVPLGQGHILLMEDGRSYMQWLDGISFKFPVGAASKRKTQVTIRVSEGNDAVLGLEHATGTVEDKRYSHVVNELFANVRSQCTRRVWPSIKTSETNNHPTKKNAAKKNTANRSKRGARGDTMTTTACRPEDFMPDVWMSDISEDEDEDDELALNPRNEVSNSVRTAFWNGLNSSEGHFGSDLLFKMANFHDKHPNDELCRNFIDLLWQGPRHNKQQFPDCIRMELAANYLDLMKTTKGMAAKLSSNLPPTFVTDFLEQMATPATIYCVEEDESRVTSAALKRVGQTLSVKNSGASLLCYLLQHQMKGYTRFGKDASAEGHSNEEIEAFKRTLQGRALIRDIIGAKDGAANALKCAVKATFSLLVHYGHYLSGAFCFPAAPENEVESELDKIPPHATLLDQAFVAGELRNLLKTMGRICSYLAWLHSIDQEERNLYKTRYLVRDAVDSLLSSKSLFNPTMFLSSDVKGMKSEAKLLNFHWIDMRIQFTSSLDKRISGNLGRLVAELSDCPTTYY